IRTPECASGRRRGRATTNKQRPLGITGRPAPPNSGESKSPMSTATDAELIAIGERFEKLLLEHMDAWLVWAPRMRAAHAEVRDNTVALAAAMVGCSLGFVACALLAAGARADHLMISEEKIKMSL